MFNIPALIFPAFFLKPKLLGHYNAIRNLSEATLLKFLLRISSNVIYYRPRDALNRPRNESEGP